MNRPTLLQKRSAPDDLRHVRLNRRWDTRKPPHQDVADCMWKSYRSRMEPEFRAWLPQETHLCLETARHSLPAPNGRPCIRAAWPSGRTPSHWPDNCNGQTRHRPCSETSLREAWFCPDRGLLGTLGTGGVEPEASSAPTRHQLFEYSWCGSIAGRSSEKQAKGRCNLVLRHETQ